MKYRTKAKIIRALSISMLALIILLFSFMPMMGAAMAEAATGDALATVAEPMTWDYLATVGGCAVFVLLFVQATKKMLDKWLYIPTTLYAYVIAVLTMLAATAFSGGLTLSNGLLTLFNGWLVSATASKTYDVMTGK